MKSEDKMTNEHYISLKTDVKAILNLLEGNSRFMQKGLVERVGDNEEQMKLARIEHEKLERSFENFKTKIIAYTAGAAAVATAVIQVALAFFI